VGGSDIGSSASDGTVMVGMVAFFVSLFFTMLFIGLLYLALFDKSDELIFESSGDEEVLTSTTHFARSRKGIHS
jgi:hypothetical protein